MSAPAVPALDECVQLDDIEHLDHEIGCDECDQRPAEFFVDQHRCFDYLLCGTCLERNRREFDAMTAEGLAILCPFCRVTFCCFDSFAEVKPL